MSKAVGAGVSQRCIIRGYRGAATADSRLLTASGLHNDTAAKFFLLLFHVVWDIHSDGFWLSTLTDIAVIDLCDGSWGELVLFPSRL